jgi:hypothetical protein
VTKLSPKGSGLGVSWVQVPAHCPEAENMGLPYGVPEQGKTLTSQEIASFPPPSGLLDVVQSNYIQSFQRNYGTSN